MILLAKDRTVAGAYSVRPRPDARVSAPVTWDELDSCDPEEFTLYTMPARFKAVGDRHHEGQSRRLVVHADDRPQRASASDTGARAASCPQAASTSSPRGVRT